MELNTFATIREQRRDIMSFNRRLQEMVPVQNGQMHFTRFLIKGVTNNRDILYQVTGKQGNIFFAVNIPRFYFNGVEVDFETITSAASIADLMALSQKPYYA